MSSNLQICSICKKEFKSKNAKATVAAHFKRCDNVNKFLLLYNLNKEKIEKEYINLGSVLNFQLKYPYWKNFTNYYKLFKDLHIDYSLKKSLCSDITIKKRKNTCLLKYGVESNFTKDCDSRKKWEKNLFDKEGIINVFQRESVKKKSVETIIRKYGKELWLHSITSREKGVISKLNKKIFEILEKNNINFTIEFKILRPDSYYYAYDILLENNKIIEINGDYWHGNPLIYKEKDILLKGSSKEILVKDKWNYDNKKIEFAKNNNYEIIVIWESEIKENIEKVTEKLISYAKS